jgi:two-component system chemotaxis response regulator CheY
MTTQVLVVEDSRAMRNYISSILEANGDFEVQQVENGFDALRALPRGSFGLILTDVNMPDVNGIELAQFVRKQPRHRDTPLVAISTDSSDVDRKRALAAGATAFLPKPFEPDDLLELVTRVLAEVRTEA